MRRLLPSLATAMLLIAPLGSAAQAEVAEKSDSGFLIRHSVEVPADSWAAWAALIAPAKWWSAEHTWSGKADNLYIDSQATGCFCELMPVPEGAPEGTRRGSVEHMHLIHVNPGKVLRMKGGLGPLQSEAVDGVLTITLKTTPAGTRILWEYSVGGYMRYKVDEIAPAVDKVIGEQVARLGKLLGAAEEKPAELAPAAPKAPEESAAPAKPAAVEKSADPLSSEFDAAMTKAAPVKPKAAPVPKKPVAPK